MLVHGAEFKEQVIGLLRTLVIMIFTHQYLPKSRRIFTFWIANMLSISLEKTRKAWVQCDFEHRDLINFLKEF